MPRRELDSTPHPHTRRDIFTKETYIYTDIYYGEDIHMERHIQGRHTHERHTYGRGIYTKRQTRGHIGRNIHTKRHTHIGTHI